MILAGMKNRPFIMPITTPTNFINSIIRFKSTARPKQNRSSSSSKDKSSAIARPKITKIGVPMDSFIPLRRSRLLNLITISPKLFFYNIFKNTYLKAFNTWSIYQFKKSMGKETEYKPNFMKYKNQAIETFVKVNKLFSQKKIQKGNPIISDYVYFGLSKRLASLPKDIKIGWELVKFNTKPKLISFASLPHEDGSILLNQITYKFDTKQKFTILKRPSDNNSSSNDNDNNNLVQTEVKDVVEYLVFNFDPYSHEVCLAGSLFETQPSRPLSPSEFPSQKDAVQSMINNGDIYRQESDLFINDKNLKLIK